MPPNRASESAQDGESPKKEASDESLQSSACTSHKNLIIKGVATKSETDIIMSLLIPIRRLDSFVI